ncbi:hypothetical protein GCM10009733_077710 [Nonomuraea maheshkhaliensis]|uniref:Uncharacterized protein n=1 Tax=Nonomuraea maheshkhaliensis TaxID=419590 RepID=A0ABP4SEV8_9ACTN
MIPKRAGVPAHGIRAAPLSERGPWLMAARSRRRGTGSAAPVGAQAAAART